MTAGFERLPDGIVFDCDGTLADTESISHRAWTETLREFGYEASNEDFRAVIGHPFVQNWSYFSSRAALGDRDHFRRRLRARFLAGFEEDPLLYPDAVESLRLAAEAGVAIAVASSSSHGHVARVLESGGLDGLVTSIIGSDDVDRHKPAPEPFLAATECLGLSPADCVAVEDTPTGIQSAVTAGLFTVAVIRDHVPSTSLREADRVVPKLTLGSLHLPTHSPGGG